MDHMEGGSQMLSGSHSNEFLRNYVNAFLDSNSIKGRQWVIFAAAWNEVIDQVRAWSSLERSSLEQLGAARSSSEQLRAASSSFEQRL